SDVTAGAALLHGAARGDGTPMRAWFEWQWGWDVVGATQTMPPITIGAAARAHAISAPLVGLPCGTRYAFHLVVENASGTTVGGRSTFETLPCGQVPTHAK